MQRKYLWYPLVLYPSHNLDPKLGSASLEGWPYIMTNLFVSYLYIVY